MRISRKRCQNNVYNLGLSPFLAFSGFSPPLGWLGRDMQLRELGKWIVQLGSGAVEVASSVLII